MCTLFVMGSPRKKGNSEILARTVAAELEGSGRETDFLYLNECSIISCQACGGCEKTGCCVIGKDDMASLYQRVEKAQNIVLVSPVYFYGLTAQLKGFVDRFQASWAKKYILKQRDLSRVDRRGYFIGCAATSGKRLFDGCLLTIKCYFDAIDVPYGGELLIRNVDTAGEVSDSLASMDKAKDFGRLIVSNCP